MKKPYIIIYEHGYDKLEARVAEAMEQGYKPHGSMVFRPAETVPAGAATMELKSAFIQPMVLKN